MVAELYPEKMCPNFKAPPTLKKSVPFKVWVEEVNLWQKHTDLQRCLQGPAIYLTLEGKARDNVQNLNINVVNIIDQLRKLYIGNGVVTVLEHYKVFENFERPNNMTLKQYIREFEHLLSKTSECRSELIAYKLFQSANLSEIDKQLVLSTIPEFSYISLKAHLLNISENCNISFAEAEIVGLETVKLDSPSSQGFEKQNGNLQKSSSGRTSFPADSINQPVGNLYDHSFSVDVHPVNLFQSNLVTENDMKTLVYESLSTAILDSGVTATVAGRVWMECYLDSLTEKEKSRVCYAESNTSFCFSAGEIVSSIGKVTIPAIIGSKSVTVEVDLVDKDIPLLLSDESLKKANTSINFKDCTVKMFGKKLNCIFTSAGHIAVPLNKNLNVLHAVETSSAKVNINFQYIDGSDMYEIATKLHSVFSHCPASKLIKIRENSATGFNEIVSVKLTSFKGR